MKRKIKALTCAHDFIYLVAFRSNRRKICLTELISGKILEDEKAIKEYDISAFIVVMVSKPKPKPAAQSTEVCVSSEQSDLDVFKQRCARVVNLVMCVYDNYSFLRNKRF